MPFPIAQLLQGAAEARSAYTGGRREARAQSQQQQIAQALQMLQLKRQAQQDQLAQALQAAQMRNIDSQIATRRPPPAPRDPVADHAANRQFDVNHPLPTTTTAAPVVAMQGGKRTYVKPSDAVGMEAPAPTSPQDSFSFPVVAGPNGPVLARANNKTGQVEPTDIGAKETSTGYAKIQGIVNNNKKSLSVINDALSELDAHPDAIGLKRGLGELPFMGKIGDAVNQRLDPGGVGARAQIANIGSLIIHDRSGAAVTVSEFPRLAPFVPREIDTPEAIRIKLKKLAEGIEMETRLYQEGIDSGRIKPQGDTAAPPSQPGGRTITVNGKTFKVPN